MGKAETKDQCILHGTGGNVFTYPADYGQAEYETTGNMGEHRANDIGMRTEYAENKSRSEVVSDALEKYYVMKRWEGLQKFCSRKAKRIGIHSEKDVDRLIHEFRR